jgi:hypothetical protein
VLAVPHNVGLEHREQPIGDPGTDLAPRDDAVLERRVAARLVAGVETVGLGAEEVAPRHIELPVERLPGEAKAAGGIP